MLGNLALQDQTSMAGASDTAPAWLSTYRRQKGMRQANKGDTHTNTYRTSMNSTHLQANSNMAGSLKS